jgi:hypothetical protein
MAALTCRDGRSGLRAERLRDTLWAVSGVVRSVAAGLVPLALHESFARGDTRRAGHRIEPMLRASVMTAALVLVFGSLLRSADPLFASLFSLPALDVGTVLSHAILMALFCWLTGGWIRAALDTREPTASPAGVGVRLGVLEVTAALGALNLLFTAYLLTQLGWYFGGERFLRERTGLTAAAYARDGFFQIACVMLLVIPVLMATRAMLPDDRALRRRHSRLALPLIGLLGLMLLSAASRMLLYVHYFGLTTDRVYPMVVMTWLGVVLGWFGWTELRGNGARFVSGTIVSGLLVLATMNVMSPDVLVARIDIARASGTGSDARRHLDREYLASLSGDAVPLVVQATLAPVRSGARGAARVESERQRCRAAVRLLEDWGAGSSAASSRRWESAWRTWNAGQARGLRAVRDGAPALRALAQRGCPDSAMAPRPPSTQR